MTLAATVHASDVAIGEGHPPVFLADIGTSFNQDLGLGERLIDQVAQSGLAFLKAEVLHNADVCLDVDLEEVIVSRGLRVSRERYREVIERKVLALGDYQRLFARARSAGLRLALSVYDDAGLRFALDEGAALVKVASSNIVHQPLIQAVAASGRPAIIDTGRATLAEIARAVEWFVQSGGRELIVQHSPVAPPAPASEQDLGMMRRLREMFGCPVGLSDHHAGDEMLYAATALGAHVLEKGVCPDAADCDQDLGHALPAGMLADVVRKCENVYAAVRQAPCTRIVPAQRHPARMGILAARDLPAGHRIEPADLAFAFPVLGVPVEDCARVVGCRLRAALRGGEALHWSSLRAPDE